MKPIHSCSPLLVAIALGATAISLPFTTQAADISGVLATNTTWTKSGGPYVLRGEVTVSPAMTLTIEPGTVVKISGGYALWIQGHLTARGAAADPVYFTDYRDDSIGGDTNGDGGASQPQPGAWRSINIVDAGSAELEHCIIRYGGMWESANVYKTGSGDLRMSYCTLERGGTYGLRLNNSTGGHLLQTNQFLNHSSFAIFVESPQTSLDGVGNTFAGNKAAPLAFAGGGGEHQHHLGHSGLSLLDYR